METHRIIIGDQSLLLGWAEDMKTKPCPPHWWNIDEVSKGICRKCDATKHFNHKLSFGSRVSQKFIIKKKPRLGATLGDTDSLEEVEQRERATSRQYEYLTEEE